MSESTMIIDRQGSKRWRNSAGEYHRIGGPAIEWISGAKVWYVNGKRHRTDGPAIEWANGEKSWWVDGMYLDYNDEGFWKLWDTLTDEQKKDPTLLSYLPGDLNV